MGKYKPINSGSGDVQSVNSKTGAVVLNAADVGAASVADLANKADLVGGKIPASQLPAGIDEITEVATFSALPVTGAPSMIYLVLDTNKEYRWAGTQYSVISDSIALGETASTAFRGDHGKAAYNRTLALNNVDNTSDENKPVSIATQTALDTKQATLVGSGVGQNIKTVNGLPVTGSGNIPFPARIKSEIVWTGLTLSIPTTATNLVTLLKAITPSSGVLIGSTFFDTTGNKMVVQNKNASVNFKLSIDGSWTGASVARSMTLLFSGTVPDYIVEGRDQSVTSDRLLFINFFSVDIGGFLATNGSTITIQSNGGAFTANTIKLIAEQVV